MMMHLWQELPLWLGSLTHWSDGIQGLAGYGPGDWTVLAQFKDTLGTDFQKALDHFVKSGQMWAMIIGFMFGYMIKTFTSF
jgi:hypothetical protein